MDKWLRNTNVVRVVALVIRDFAMGCCAHGGDEFIRKAPPSRAGRND